MKNDCKNIVFSHYDLDGCASAAVCMAFLGEDDFRQIVTGYLSRDKKIQDVIKEAKAAPTRIWITDLDIEPEVLSQFLAIPNVKSIVYCDHHPKDPEWFEKVNEMGAQDARLRVYFKENECGALIAYNALSKIFKKEKPEMRKLAFVADTYDRFVKSRKSFEASVDYNTLFWIMKYDKFFKYVKNGYRFGKTARKLVDEHHDIIRAYIADTIENHSIITNIGKYKCLVCLNPEGNYLNEISRVSEDFDVFIMFGSAAQDGLKFSIRAHDNFCEDGADLNEACKMMETLFPNYTCGGHPFAVGVFINNSNDVEREVTRMVEVLELHVNKQSARRELA